MQQPNMQTTLLVVAPPANQEGQFVYALKITALILGTYGLMVGMF